jgi:transcription initiation factor TFIIB
MTIANRIRIRKCPECGSKNVVTDPTHAELYCADCGMIIVENIVDLGPEWRAYDSEQASKRIRTGPPMSYRIHDRGLSTPMPKLPMRTRSFQWTSMDSSEKTLAFALVEIDRMASALRLPNYIKEETSVLYRKAARHKLIKGRSIEELVSAMLYITCRQCGVPRTLKEIAGVSRMPLRKIRRAYLFLLKKLNIKLALADPACYIPRFCSELELRDVIRERAIGIIKESRKRVAAKGWAPAGTAAGAIYLALTLSGEVGYQEEKEIAKIAGTTPATLRKRYKELEKGMESNIDLHSQHHYRGKKEYMTAII